MEEPTQAPQLPPYDSSKESIELDLTAKGLYKWTIKLREEFLSVASLTRLADLSKELNKLYPNNVMNAPTK